MAHVIRAYKTEVHPLGGNITEEVLELSNGQGIYLNPCFEDECYATVSEALEACEGTPAESASLLAAWEGREFPGSVG